MKRFARNNGFTLVELMVTILIGSIVTLSATTILLLGVRIMHKSNDTAERQNTTRVLLTAIESLAAEGTITEVRDTKGPDENGDEVTLTWQVMNGTKAVFSFDRAEKIIYTGAGEDKAPLLTAVRESSVQVSGHVLTFSVLTEEHEEPYVTSINCRMLVDNYRGDQTGTDLVDELIGGQNILPGAGNENNGRNEFLKVLASQYGSRGYIMDEAGRTNKYYSEWYLEKQYNDGYEAHPGWNENTPWCACYVSWALAQSSVIVHVGVTACPCHAQVEDFRAYFETRDLLTTSVSGRLPGDLVFFNTDEDPEYDHMGVVLAIQDGILYTIEGNSYNRVRVRDYDLSLEENGIVAYGVLPWIE